MAITKTTLSITWPTAASTATVSAASTATSEALSIAAAEVSGEFIPVLTTGGTETNYTVEFYLLGSADGTNYSSAGQAAERLHIGTLNAAAISTTYRGKPFNVPLGLSSYKFYVVSNAATDSVTVDVEGKSLNVA